MAVVVLTIHTNLGAMLLIENKLIKTTSRRQSFFGLFGCITFTCRLPSRPAFLLLLAYWRHMYSLWVSIFIT